MFVAGYWVLCLLAPFAATRSALAMTAVVLAMPTMIRMWTEVDEPGETAVVGE